MKTKTVKFLVDRVTESDPPKRFSAGEEYELPAASADRWVMRGMAIYIKKQEAPINTKVKEVEEIIIAEDAIGINSTKEIESVVTDKSDFSDSQDFGFTEDVKELKEEEDEVKPQLTIKHMGRGRFALVDENGNRMSDFMSKEEAQGVLNEQ